METLSMLIDFLHEKGFYINSKSPYEIGDSSGAHLSAHERLKKLNDQQKVFNAIMHELSILHKIMNTKGRNEDIVNKEFEKYKNTHVEQICSGNIDFNERHPLYGYKAFADLLMVHYINTEEYEKCKEINELTPHHESYF